MCSLLGSVRNKASIFVMLPESAGNLDGGRSGTSQRDSIYVHVTGTEVQRLSRDQEQSEFSDSDDDYRQIGKQLKLGRRQYFTGRLGNRYYVSGFNCTDDDVAEFTVCDLLEERSS